IAITSNAQSCTSSLCLPERDPIHARDHGLAIDDKPLLPVLQRGFDDPRISLRPVIAAPGDQTHAIAVPLNAEPAAVVLTFVKPFRAGWHGLAGSRRTELKRL